MLADEQTTGIKNIYLLRIAPYTDQQSMEAKLAKQLCIKCIVG